LFPAKCPRTSYELSGKTVCELIGVELARLKLSGLQLAVLLLAVKVTKLPETIEPL
jgi:hypothetical protein